jgi:hypothetical protein
MRAKARTLHFSLNFQMRLPWDGGEKNRSSKAVFRLSGGSFCPHSKFLASLQQNSFSNQGFFCVAAENDLQLFPRKRESFYILKIHRKVAGAGSS